MKLHYFDDEAADRDDYQLGMAIAQGYVPKPCLLGGVVVMREVQLCRCPCAGCAGPRDKCKGKVRE